MRKPLRILALLIFAGAMIAWLATGANRGWSKNSRAVKSMDEITGIEGIAYEKSFQPGVDFLGVAMLGAAVLAGASFIFRGSKLQPTTST